MDYKFGSLVSAASLLAAMGSAHAMAASTYGQAMTAGSHGDLLQPIANPVAVLAAGENAAAARDRADDAVKIEKVQYYYHHHHHHHHRFFSPFYHHHHHHHHYYGGYYNPYYNPYFYRPYRYYDGY